VSPENYHVRIPDHCPAYINVSALKPSATNNRNQFSRETMGRRDGEALLGEMISRARGRRMTVYYPGVRKAPRISARLDRQLPPAASQSLSGQVLDGTDSGEALKALEPAALELSLVTADTFKRETPAWTRIGGNG